MLQHQCFSWHKLWCVIQIVYKYLQCLVNITVPIAKEFYVHSKKIFQLISIRHENCFLLHLALYTWHWNCARYSGIRVQSIYYISIISCRPAVSAHTEHRVTCLTWSLWYFKQFVYLGSKWRNRTQRAEIEPKEQWSTLNILNFVNNAKHNSLKSLHQSHTS